MVQWYFAAALRRDEFMINFNKPSLTGSMISGIFGKIGIPLILRLPEIWQNIFVAPARIASRFPLIEVSAIASDVQHRIQHL